MQCNLSIVKLLRLREKTAFVLKSTKPSEEQEKIIKELMELKQSDLECVIIKMQCNTNIVTLLRLKKKTNWVLKSTEPSKEQEKLIKELMELKQSDLECAFSPFYLNKTFYLKESVDILHLRVISRRLEDLNLMEIF